MKNIYIFAVLLFVGCANIQTQTATQTKPSHHEQNATQKKVGDKIDRFTTSVNWKGYYYGKLPCDKCEYVKTWLWLKDVNQTGEYELIQKYKHVKNEFTSGGIGWQKDGTVIELYNSDEKKDKKLFLGEGSVSFLSSVYDSIDYDLTLEKLDAFESDFATLLVNPRTILEGKIHAQDAVKFHGMTNFSEKTPDGYSSFDATYIVHCKYKKFEMNDVKYYEKPFSLGYIIYPKEKLGGVLYSITPTNTVMQGVYDKYCPK